MNLKNYLTVYGGAVLNAALAYLLPHLSSTPLDWTDWRPILLAALVAGFTAALNLYHLNQVTPQKMSRILAKTVSASLSVIGILLVGAMFSCTPAQTAQAQTDTTQAIDLTDAVCAVAPDSPLGQPYVDLICSLGEAGEQLVSIVIGAIATVEGDSGSASMGAITTGSTMIRVPVKQIRFTIPAASSAKFLAAHSKKK
jgi:hypothetical protein